MPRAVTRVDDATIVRTAQEGNLLLYASRLVCTAVSTLEANPAATAVSAVAAYAAQYLARRYLARIMYLCSPPRSRFSPSSSPRDRWEDEAPSATQSPSAERPQPLLDSPGVGDDNLFARRQRGIEVAEAVLRQRGISDDDVATFAKAWGVDPSADADLLPLVRVALAADLPTGWAMLRNYGVINFARCQEMDTAVPPAVSPTTFVDPFIGTPTTLPEPTSSTDSCGAASPSPPDPLRYQLSHPGMARPLKEIERVVVARRRAARGESNAVATMSSSSPATRSTGAFPSPSVQRRVVSESKASAGMPRADDVTATAAWDDAFVGFVADSKSRNPTVRSEEATHQGEGGGGTLHGAVATPSLARRSRTGSLDQNAGSQPRTVLNATEASIGRAALALADWRSQASQRITGLTERLLTATFSVQGGGGADNMTHAPVPAAPPTATSAESVPGRPLPPPSLPPPPLATPLRKLAGGVASSNGVAASDSAVAVPPASGASGLPPPSRLPAPPPPPPHVRGPPSDAPSSMRLQQPGVASAGSTRPPPPPPPPPPTALVRPPPPPPSPPGSVPVGVEGSSVGGGRAALMDEIRKGMTLKRAAPQATAPLPTSQVAAVVAAAAASPPRNWRSELEERIRKRRPPTTESF
mgnify:CR=1 FL=1